MKITFPIFYCFFSIMAGFYPLTNNYIRNGTACPSKKKINSKYQIIKINDVEIILFNYIRKEFISWFFL